MSGFLSAIGAHGTGGTGAFASLAMDRSSPPKVTSVTQAVAPDGSAKTRTRVGPGERVDLYAARRVLWSATAGKLTADRLWEVLPEKDPTEEGSRKVTWEAPETGGAVTITVRDRRGTESQLVFTVVPPESIRMTRFDTLLTKGEALPVSNNAGAAMRAIVNFDPMDVSFSRVQWLEEPQPTADGVTGYFQTLLDLKKIQPGDLAHHPNVEYVAVRDDNTHRFDSIHMLDLPPLRKDKPRFELGDCYWTIPNRYRVAGGGGPGVLFVTTYQLFLITPSGTVDISKEGAEVTRTISGVVI